MRLVQFFASSTPSPFEDTDEGGPVNPKVRWEEMFPDELDAALARCPLVYLTYGLCEPHGLHNAVGLDALKAHALACRAAQAHGGLVAPPFFWHVHEIGYHAAWGARTIGDRNPWLTSLPPWVFFQMFFYHLRAAGARGFHAAIVITGHYGGPGTIPFEEDTIGILAPWA